MKQEIIDHIKNKLSAIEKEHNVQILYAVESGSRAWGFESVDSDYDVRFIYVHPKDYYLSVFNKRDVIEYPIVDDFDYSGWDLKKTLFLLSKSNPVLLEWLRSPIVYRKSDSHVTILKKVSDEYFSLNSSIHHYLHMAQGNFREYLKKDKVRTKKYFYVLRPILACIWIEKFNESPPMEFERLLDLVKNDTLIYEHIFNLLERKRSGMELGTEKRIDALNAFIEKKLQYYNIFLSQFKKRQKNGEEYLDSIFRTLLNM